jgi:hypothetical protein
MRSEIPPVPPQSLSPYAREILQLLAGHPEAAEIVIGGGVALSHYAEYRETFDLDAWWATAPTAAARHLIATSLQVVATRHGLFFHSRSWGETESFELTDGQRKIFSLQIAARDRFLDAPIEAAWPPVQIETLRDNIASKMTALVERGAPRDLRDIHHLCSRHLIDVDECWDLYRMKNPQHDPHEAAAKILYAIERLEMQRPLDTIPEARDRHEAATVRAWFREVFCRPPQGGST